MGRMRGASADRIAVATPKIEDEHREHDTRDSELHVGAVVLRGDEARLDDEQHEPRGERDAVQVQQQLDGRHVEPRAQVVGAREASEHQHRQASAMAT